MSTHSGLSRSGGTDQHALIPLLLRSARRLLSVAAAAPLNLAQWHCFAVATGRMTASAAAARCCSGVLPVEEAWARCLLRHIKRDYQSEARRHGQLFPSAHSGQLAWFMLTAAQQRGRSQTRQLLLPTAPKGLPV
jgi:hypothetical protein